MIFVQKTESEELEKLILQAATINNLIACKGKMDGSDPLALGYYEVEGGGAWLRVVWVRAKQAELLEDNEMNT